MLLTVEIEVEVELEHVNAFAQLPADDTHSGGGTIAQYIRRRLVVANCCLLGGRMTSVSYHNININHKSSSLML